MDPLVHEWFYDLERDAVVALNTTTTRICMYLGHFHDANTFIAPTVPTASHAISVVSSTSPMYLQPSTTLPEFEPMLLGSLL